MGDTQTLNLVIDANTEIARDKLDGLGGVVEKLGQKFRATNSLAVGFVGGLAGGLLEGVGEKFIEASKRAFEFAGNIGEIAERSGTTTKAVQELRFALREVGGSSEQADKALAILNTRIGDAESGNRSAAQGFKLLGVDLVDATGKTRPLIDVYRDVAAAIAKLPDPAQQAAAAQRVFKDSGTDLLPLLREGAVGFDNYAASAAKLGQVMTPEQIEHAHELQVEMGQLKDKLDVEFATAITANADSLLSLAKGLIAAADGLAKFNAQHPDQFKAGVATLGVGSAAYLGGKVGGAPGAIAAGVFTAGMEAQAYGAKRKQGRAIIANQNGGGVYGYIQGFVASNDEAEGAVDTQASNAARRRSAAGSRATASGGTGRVGDAANPYADQVLTQLGNRASFGGDARAAFIASQLSAAHVDDPGSALGKRIVAAAGRAYDDGPGKLAAAAAARRTASADRSAEIARMAAATRLEAGNRDVTTAQRQARNATADAADTPEARYDADRANIADTLADKLDQAKREGPTGTKKYTADQVKLLDQAAQTVAIGQQIVLDKREEERKLQEKLTLQESDFENQKEVLQTQLALATTTGERRDIELHLLELQDQEAIAREKINKQLAEASGNLAAAKVAQDKINTIEATAPGRREAVERSNQGPIADYGSRIARTGAQANEALQGVAAGGLKSLEDGLVGIVTGTESVGQAFKKMALAIISDLIRIAIEYAIIGPILSALGFPAIGGFGGPRAAGGPVEGGKTYLVGEEGPELFTAPGGGGTITANHRLLPPTSPRTGGSGGGGGGERQAVDVTIRTEPSDYFLTQAHVLATQAGRQGAVDVLQQVNRPSVPGGWG